MAREASDNFFNIWGDNGGGICFNFSTSVTLPMGGSSDAEKKCYLRKLGDWLWVGIGKVEIRVNDRRIGIIKQTA